MNDRLDQVAQFIKVHKDLSIWKVMSPTPDKIGVGECVKVLLKCGSVETFYLVATHKERIGETDTRQWYYLMKTCKSTIQKERKDPKIWDDIPIKNWLLNVIKLMKREDM